METTKKEIKFTEALRLVKELGQPYITACQVVHKNYNVLKMRNLNGHGSQYYKTPHSLWCSVDRVLEKKKHRDRINKRKSRARLKQKQNSEPVFDSAFKRDWKSPKSTAYIKEKSNTSIDKIKLILSLDLSDNTKILAVKELLK